MLNSFRKSSSQNVGRPIRSFVFFILFYLYLWLEVDLRLIYHSGGAITNFPAFFRGWAFFQEFTSYPGGLVEYLSALLSQFFCIGWAGALVVTLQAWLICVCTDYFLKAINASRLRWVRFIPPILLLTTYTRYTYHFVTTAALLTALLFVCLHIRITPKSKLPCLAVFLTLSVILYAVAGAAYLLFAVLCAIYELLLARRWQMGLLYLLSAAVIPYVEGVLIFGVSIVEAFSELLPFSAKILFFQPHKRMVIAVHILYLLLPLTALGLGLWRMLVRSLAFLPNQPNISNASGANSNEVEKKVKKKLHEEILSWYSSTPVLRWAIESCLLFVVAGAAVFLFHDNERKTVLEVDYYGCHKNWPQVLQAARRWPRNDFIAHTANRALYHTGRFNCDMFSYRQHSDILFLTGEKHTLSEWNRYGICIELGFMNKAESDMTDSLERLGERPIILKRLALINMVKGNISTARIYLGALSKTFFYADWANNYLARLQSDPNLSTDDQIQHLRRRIVKKDDENILLALLEKSGQSRMAFEYLMAWYLLDRRLDKFVQHLDRLDDFDYPNIPRLYEEAIFIHMSKTKKAVELHGRQISPESLQRCKGFIQIFNHYRGNEQAAMNELAKDYGDSYFFYYTYGRSGIRK